MYSMYPYKSQYSGLEKCRVCRVLSAPPIVYDADEINDDALIHRLVVDYY